MIRVRSKARSNRNAGSQSVPWQRADAEGLSRFLLQTAASHPDRSSLVVVCIGTDRSTGDSLGPWIGTMLQERGWANVIGTLGQPCDADHYEAAVAAIRPGQTIIAIDACLGKPGESAVFLLPMDRCIRHKQQVSGCPRLDIIV